MSTATETTTRERVRVYATGSCEGFDKLLESLATHPEIELVGASTSVAAMTNRIVPPNPDTNLSV